MIIHSYFRTIITVAFICILPCAFCKAQCTQKGKVLQYQGKQKKTALGGVEILAANAGSTISGEQGEFSLNFKKLKVGDKIIARVEKNGYVLFNKEAVDQWHISRTGQPFSIVMCKEEKYREIRNNYERISSECYARQQKEEEKKLLALRKQNKLTEENYKKQLKQLQNEYETRLENLDTYIDRVARYDISELSEKENEIIALMQQGKVDEALKEYDEMNLEEKLEREIKIIGSLTVAEEKLNNTVRENRQIALRTYESIRRKHDVMYLAGGTENMKKIKESMKEVAFTDTTFTRAMIDFVLFLEKDKEYVDALDMAMIALRNVKDKADQYSLYLILGEIFTYLTMFDKAEEMYQFAYEFIGSLYKEEPELLAFYGQSVVRGIAGLYMIQGKSEEAEEVYAELSEYTKELREELGDAYSMDDIVIDIDRVKNHFLNTSYDASLDLAHKTIERLGQLCKDSSNDTECELNLSILYAYMASALYQTKNFSEASSYIDKSIVKLEIKCKTHFNEYAEVLSEAYNVKGGIMRTKRKYQEAIEYYEKSIRVVDSIMTIKPSSALLLVRNMLDVATNLGIAYNNTRQCDKGIAVLKNAISAFEMYGMKSINGKAKYTSALMGLSNAYFCTGDIKNAVYYCKKTLENAEAGYSLSSKNFAVLYTLALYNYCRVVCVPSGDYTTGESLIKKAISIYKKKESEQYEHIESSYYMLAFIYQLQGKNKDAEDVVNYGVKQFPNDIYFLDAKGELLMKKGKRREAMEIWNKILTIDSNWPSNGSDFSKMVLNNRK